MERKGGMYVIFSPYKQNIIEHVVIYLYIFLVRILKFSNLFSRLISQPSRILIASKTSWIEFVCISYYLLNLKLLIISNNVFACLFHDSTVFTDSLFIRKPLYKQVFSWSRPFSYIESAL